MPVCACAVCVERVNAAAAFVFTETKAEKHNKKPVEDYFHGLFYGGPEGIRTLDLSDANRTRSQLRYRPIYTAPPQRVLS